MPRPTSRSFIERHIADLAHALGWRLHKERCLGLTADGYADGFPEVVLLRGSRLVLIAFPGRAGLTASEAAWKDGLEAVETVEMFVLDASNLAAVGRLLSPFGSGSSAAEALLASPAQTAIARAQTTQK